MRPRTVRVAGIGAGTFGLGGVALLLCLTGAPMTQAQAPAKAQKAPAAKKEAAKPAETQRVLQLRDPFRSLIQRGEEAGGQPLPPGKRGLVITQLSVDGIVVTPTEKIAVVNMRGRNRAYFLRERDEVYNGFVARITEDAVIFRERATDAYGQTFEREVTKTISGLGAKR